MKRETPNQSGTRTLCSYVRLQKGSGSSDTTLISVPDPGFRSLYTGFTIILTFSESNPQFPQLKRESVVAHYWNLFSTESEK